MQLVTFTVRGSEPRAGVLTEVGVIDLTAAGPLLPNSVRQILALGPEAVAEAGDLAANLPAITTDYRLLAPIPDPPKVICIGLNYADHAAEAGLKPPREPVVFSKFATSVAGPEDTIRLPKVSQEVDYEAELVVVIGRRGRDWSAAEAHAAIAGYTCGNDVSARDWQIGKDGKQWLLGKTFDTFAPMGPALVTADEIRDPQNLDISLTLNGQVVQQSNTRQMIFGVVAIVQYLSQVFTLEPGDVIFTGTPPGVGMARKPPLYLKPGDECRVTIDRVGTLVNRCE